jgi:uncharacterized protein (TIGR00106 family)
MRRLAENPLAVGEAGDPRAVDAPQSRGAAGEVALLGSARRGRSLLPPRDRCGYDRGVATADPTVIPFGREGAGTGDGIAEIQRRLKRQDQVGFRMRAMGKSLEGCVEDILAPSGEFHAVPFEAGIPRLYTPLKLDERRVLEQGLDYKVDSVRGRLREDRADYPPGD